MGENSCQHTLHLHRGVCQYSYTGTPRVAEALAHLEWYKQVLKKSAMNIARNWLLHTQGVAVFSQITLKCHCGNKLLFLSFSLFTED